jgi:hypothetical protein
LIDDLLLRCLAWPKEHVVAEDRFEARYTDYSMGSSSSRLAEEAKRKAPTRALFEQERIIDRYNLTNVLVMNSTGWSEQFNADSSYSTDVETRNLVVFGIQRDICVLRSQGAGA